MSTLLTGIPPDTWQVATEDDLLARYRAMARPGAQLSGLTAFDKLVMSLLDPTSLDRQRVERIYRRIREIPDGLTIEDLFEHLETAYLDARSRSMQPFGDARPGLASSLISLRRGHPGLISGNAESVHFKYPDVVLTHEDCTVDLGTLIVVIPLSCLGPAPNWSEVRVTNDRVKGRSGYIHPHVDTNGKPCWGEASALFRTALPDTDRFQHLFDVIDGWIRTYGQGVAYARLSSWDQAMCTKCRRYFTSPRDYRDADGRWVNPPLDPAACPNCHRIACPTCQGEEPCLYCSDPMRRCCGDRRTCARCLRSWHQRCVQERTAEHLPAPRIFGCLHCGRSEFICNHCRWPHVSCSGCYPVHYRQYFQSRPFRSFLKRLNTMRMELINAETETPERLWAARQWRHYTESRLSDCHCEACCYAVWQHARVTYWERLFRHSWANRSERPTTASDCRHWTWAGCQDALASSPWFR